MAEQRLEFRHPEDSLVRPLCKKLTERDEFVVGQAGGKQCCVELDAEEGEARCGIFHLFGG